MVYRGRPSAGCEGCRKAKKRCGLEQPACLRCVKLKKVCSGYRDTTQLQIQDESESVILKVTKAKRKGNSNAHSLSPPSITPDFGILTPASTHSDATGSSSDSGDPPGFASCSDPDGIEAQDSASMDLVPVETHRHVPTSIPPRADDVATGFFLSQFTADGHWKFVQDYVVQSNIDPCLNFAIKACGMAALDNVSNVPIGKTYSRSMYVEALSLLNAALRDPVKSKSDDSLMAVVMLGYFENLTCDSRESIRSWKAHTNGAAQLLKLRGKAQFQTEKGRAIFRETRAQILTKVLWDDEEPPRFLTDWQQDLNDRSPKHYVHLLESADHPVRVTYSFARLRTKMKRKVISDEDAADEVAELDRRLVVWSNESGSSPLYRHQNIQVNNSPHVWNRTVSCYSSFFGPTVWQAYHGLRIMMSFTHEHLLCKRLKHRFTQAQREEQISRFRMLRQQMTDAICHSIPVALGHAPSSFNSPCIVVSAYMSVWPLFFAATCALEGARSPTKWTQLQQSPDMVPYSSGSTGQAAWILGRLDYISQVIGLKWAAGLAVVLKGDLRFPEGASKIGLLNVRSPADVHHEEADTAPPSQGSLSRILG
nr:uncharacterized protein CFP56_73212 [Quercus suber]